MGYIDSFQSHSLSKRVAVFDLASIRARALEMRPQLPPLLAAQPLLPIFPFPSGSSSSVTPIIPPPPIASVQATPPPPPPSVVPDVKSHDTLLGMDKEQIMKYAPYAIGGVLLLLILKRSSK